MGAISYTYTFTGAEGRPSNLIAVALAAFSGSFTITWGVTPAVGGNVYNWQWAFYKTAGPTTCYSDTLTGGNGTPASLSYTVGGTFGTWHCTDWDHFEFGYAGATDRGPTGGTLTVTLTGAGIGPVGPPCAYGSELIEPGKTLLNFTPDLAGILLPDAANPWAVPVVIAGMAGAVALNTLCANNPPDPQTINLADWTTTDGTTQTSVAVRKILQNFQNTLWQKFCH